MQRRTVPSPQRPARSRVSMRPGGSASAFTLIELLVVVSIIAILIGLIFPGLGYARRLSQDAVCQANQHALAQAWHTYVADKGRFPYFLERPERWQDPPRGGQWGGASPKIQNANGAYAAPSAKPLNEYVGLDARNRVRMESFRCPLDDGAIYPREQVGLREYGSAVYADDENIDESMFFLHGNSYYANDWVWADVGAIDGRVSSARNLERWNHFNRPDVVLRYPADTMMLSDGGMHHSISMTDEQIGYWNIPNSWWHGKDVSFMAMWDGSVRKAKRQIGGAGPEFNRWLIPERHPGEGTPVAFFFAIRNPDLANTQPAR